MDTGQLEALTFVFCRDRYPSAECRRRRGQVTPLSADFRVGGIRHPDPIRGCGVGVAAIGLVALRMHHAAALQQRRILDCAGAARQLSPGIEARSADAVQAAHRPHRIGFLMVGDEGEDVFFRVEVNATASFKWSCSPLSRSYCRSASRNAFGSAATALSTSTPLLMIASRGPACANETV